MTLRGQITDSRTMSSADISIANPGSKNSNTRPEIDYTGELYATEEDNITYPIYNLPLGVFSLLNTPEVISYTESEFFHESQPYHSAPTEEFYQKSAWKLNSPIKYVFNSVLQDDIDYENTVVKGALEIESFPAPYFAPAKAKSDLNQSYQTGADNDPDKLVFLSPFYDLNALSQAVPTLVYDEMKSWYTPYPASSIKHNVNLKILVIVQYKKLNTDGNPNRMVYILTYPVNVSSTTTDFTTIPDVSDQVLLDGKYFPTSIYYDNPLILGNTVFPYSFYSSTYSPYDPTNPHIYGAVQKKFAWNDILINGNLSLGQDVTQVTIEAGGDIIQDGESVIDSEIILETTTSDNKITPSPQITDANEIYNFCMGSSTSMNQYKSNTKFGTTNAVAKNAAGKSAKLKRELELSVYPNPVMESAAILFTIPEGNNVNIILRNMMGQKVMDVKNGYQSAGNYSVNLSTESLEEGIYFCTLQTGEKMITQKIVVVK